MPKITEKDLKKGLPPCHICWNYLLLDESYEIIVTPNKRKLYIHTDCIRK